MNVGEKPDPKNRIETARRIRDETSKLRGQAAGAGLPFLAYLLGMAEDEARSNASQP